ncbi:3-hydroxyacyl-ACP dehydratase FabZ [Parasphaerochaeta coccoides]|uniref:Beta-hydroxyacyl-(Acyl-carrier-protein) dehydratase FabA/FabZ n=1 Tax=Parasphaerochaeta coccoides (strain ATCC BAA-1237 / DSM 17374 / SPN1) TaxID=760011 RepID=F4GJL4_PARC1|nr:3-hydroxyacyl-ACP dehydratase FabZ [Parasphaerochaeta coccoides]AEC02761.1 Beta-hydroxyacyl-(acyl-carrier-protein) dehydratase FabA/FabZ [Parasphaerochaeta coccoides DSM 17374]
MSQYRTPQELLPHRPPFLFVDGLDEVSPGKVVGHKTFGEDEFFFAGHFPSYPVVPGVILVETMAQCGGAGLVEAGIYPPGVIFFLATVDKVKFRHQVRPGDTVVMTVHDEKLSNRIIRQRGILEVGGKLAVEATWMCIISDGASITAQQGNRKGNRI